jgi:hypothetical protein
MKPALFMAALAALLAGPAAAGGGHGGHHNHHHHHDGSYRFGHDDFFDDMDEEVVVYQFGSGADDSLAHGIASDRRYGGGIGPSLDRPAGATPICPVISGDGVCSNDWGPY